MVLHKPHTAEVTVGSMVNVSGRAIVQLTGKDAQDLLHRLSTNDLSALQIGGVVQTVLTNEKGRIVDVLSVLKTAAESLLLIGQTHGGESLRQWLEKFIIMEEARAENITNHYSHLLLYTTGSQDRNDWIAQNPDQFTTLERQESHAIAFIERWGIARIQHLLCPSESYEMLAQMLQGLGYLTREISDYEFYRIASGIPAYPNELSIEYNPMEVGLMEMISFTKGCYIGQEVIARLDTYKKVQRKLFRLELGAQPSHLPQRLYSGGQEVGTITSVAPSTHSGNVLALGLIKTSYNHELPLYYHSKDNKEFIVKIVD